jgi:hypothetical protein
MNRRSLGVDAELSKCKEYKKNNGGGNQDDDDETEAMFFGDEDAEPIVGGDILSTVSTARLFHRTRWTDDR